MKQIKTITIIGLIIILNITLSAFFVFNGSYGAFCIDCKIPPPTNGNINGYIIEGASNFLKSYSDILLLMQMVEVDTGNTEDMNEIIQNAIRSLGDSKTDYDNLCFLAEVTPYNITVINRLKDFDYDAYFNGEKGLNPAVFNRVKAFLKSGDVKGVYNAMFQDISEIMEKLKSIENGINAAGLPDIIELRELNQLYSNDLLFGQYAAQIFSEI
jgi:hypothetical protein